MTAAAPEAHADNGPVAAGDTRVTALTLQDFRSYPALDLAISRRMVALVGENGVGKTNLIEALSLFSPGRGMRRAELAEMARIGGANPPSFAVGLALTGPAGEHRLGVGLQARDALQTRDDRPARIYRLDGTDVNSPAAFAEHLRVVWLTPELDGLFRGSPGERRRFLDRLVLAVDGRHGARTNALDRALRSRNRLLEDGAREGAWLDAIERELAELAVAVSSARRETVERLDAECLAHRADLAPFPFGRLALAGELDDMVASLPAVDAEDRYRALLRDGRARDAAAGRTLVGPQASDLVVRHGPKDQPAALCSTGEQKALLIGLVLAHARLVAAMSGLAPLVLLDEIAAHLDPRRRAGLYDALDRLGGQVWMTGADPIAFTDLAGRANVFSVSPGHVKPLPP